MNLKKHLSKKWGRLCLSIVLLLLYMSLSAVLLLKTQWSFCWIFLLGTLVLIALTYLWGHSKLIKIILVNLAFFSFFLGCIELFMNINFKDTNKEAKTEKTGSYFDPLAKYSKPFDQTLGYRAKPNCSVQAVLSADGKNIYDISYTTNANGLRIALKPKKPDKSILFWGCSMTYGEGLDNDETFAWICGEKTGYKVLNFAFHGYGPHQMLAGIENGLVEKNLENSTPVFALFTTIPWHPERSGGWADWDAYGPKYELDSENILHYKGPFNSKLMVYFYKAMLKSRIFTKFYRAIASSDARHDVKRAVSIVNKSEALIKKKYPEIKFLVLYWGPEDDYSKALKKAGLRVIMIDEVIAEYSKNIDKYQIEIDGHPNRKAARMVGNYLSNLVVKQKTE
jgi:hypothetical protein